MDRQCKTPFYLTVDSQDDIMLYLQFSVTPSRSSLTLASNNQDGDAEAVKAEHVQCLAPQYGVLLIQDLSPFELYLDSKVSIRLGSGASTSDKLEL